MHVYNDVWNYDDDGLINGYEHVWKYMMVNMILLSMDEFKYEWLFDI